MENVSGVLALASAPGYSEPMYAVPEPPDPQMGRRSLSLRGAMRVVLVRGNTLTLGG